MRLRSLAILLAGVVLTACSAALPAARSTPVPHAGLYVDAAQRLGPISRYVYGSNTGPWQTITVDERKRSKEAGISMLRWPGGDYGDEHDPDPAQLDEFMALCHEIGAEPLIHVRLAESTAEKAAALVHLANVEKRYKVHYWEVGNEPDLYASKRHMSYTVADYVRDFKAFRAAMRAVDKTIVVMGPAISQYTGTAQDARDAAGVQWMDGFLKGVGREVDMVSYHRYPFGQPPATPQTLLADPPAWSRAIEHLRQQIRTTTGKDLPIAVTEANSDWLGPTGLEAGPDTHYNAIWWADVLGRLIRGQATIVTQFALGDVRAIGMFGDPFYDPNPFPIFQVYPLYKHFGTQLLWATSDDDSLPLFAAARDDGTLTLVLVNHSQKPRKAPITIDGFHPSGPAEVWSFAADHPVQQRGTVDLKQPVTLEPLSATLLVVPGRP
jgi:hypothetical protein